MGGCTLMGSGPSVNLRLKQAFTEPATPRKDRVFEIDLWDGDTPINTLRCSWSAKWGENDNAQCLFVNEDDRQIYSTLVYTRAIPSGASIEISLSKYTHNKPKIGLTGPDRLRVRVREDSEVYFDKSYDLEYEQHEINGPGCGIDEVAPYLDDTFEIPPSKEA